MEEIKIEWVVQDCRKGCRKWQQVDVFGTEKPAKKELEYRIRQFETHQTRLVKRTTVTTEEVVK